MGSSPSKPEAKVFTPAAPVDFSASFLASLEHSTEVCFFIGESNPEIFTDHVMKSDYSRAQYTEKYIQDRVALELDKLEKQAREKLNNIADESLIVESGDSGVSVRASNEKVTQLNTKVKENAKLAHVELSEDAKRARGEVINCLKDNKGRSLNCWDEVQNFKKLVDKL